MLQGYAIAVVHTYIMAAVYQVGTAEVGADGFIVQGQLIGIVESVFELSTAALGIALARPFLAAAILAGTSGNINPSGGRYAGKYFCFSVYFG